MAKDVRLLGARVELPLHPDDMSTVEDVKLGVGVLREKISKAAGLVIFTKEERDLLLRMLRAVEGMAQGLLDASRLAEPDRFLRSAEPAKRLSATPPK